MKQQQNIQSSKTERYNFKLVYDLLKSQWSQHTQFVELGYKGHVNSLIICHNTWLAYNGCRILFPNCYILTLWHSGTSRNKYNTCMQTSVSSLLSSLFAEIKTEPHKDTSTRTYSISRASLWHQLIMSWKITNIFWNILLFPKFSSAVFTRRDTCKKE